MEPYILFYSRGEVKQPMPQTIRSNISFNSHNNSYGARSQQQQLRRQVTQTPQPQHNNRYSSVNMGSMPKMQQQHYPRKNTSF
jgi:hypothetical protein